MLDRKVIVGLIFVFVSHYCLSDIVYHMQIDSSLSSFRYSYGGDSSNHFIAGSFDLRVIEKPPPSPWIIYPTIAENLRLENPNITTGTLPNIDFLFPGYTAEIIGNNIEGDSDYCRWNTAPGSCLSAGFKDYFSGTFDGTTLIISGVDYLSLHRDPSYIYTITAKTVPIPPSSALFLSGILLLGLRARNRY